jgi:phosphohistidine phosphatase
MAKRLFILRHAKSDWGSPAMNDFDRPLNKRGEKAATHMGRWMEKHKVRVDAIISSPALRAQQTIERVCKPMHVSLERIHWDKRLYLASCATLLEVLAQAFAEADKVMVVGHNPGLEELLVYLCRDETLPRTQAGKLLTTANLAQVNLKDDNILHTGSGELQQLVRPKDVEE